MTPVESGEAAGISPIFLRLLERPNKQEELLSVTQALRRGTQPKNTFTVSLSAFSAIPATPFCYWLTESIQLLYSALPPLGDGKRTAVAGLQSSSDFRFVRQYWEVPATSFGTRKPWVTHPKSEKSTPFYVDWTTVVRWGQEGRELKATERTEWSSPAYIRNEERYFRPALAWVRRTSRLTSRPIPRESVLSDASFGVITPEKDLLPTLALLNSRVADYLVKLSVGRTGDSVQFMPGMIGNIPWPDMSDNWKDAASVRAHSYWTLQRELDTVTQTSHAFVLPALLQMPDPSLQERASAWAQHVADHEAQMAALQDEIDDLAFDLYGLDEESQAIVLQGPGGSPASSGEEDVPEEDEEEESDEVHADEAALASALVSWLLGAAFGRFDVRVATGDVARPEDPDPFAPLTPCAPGILVTPEGLPATEDRIARAAFLNARPHALAYADPETFDSPAITAEEYPLEVAWDGILVDDSGLPGEGPASWDIVRRIQDVMEHLWGESARDREEELAGMLGVSDLRDYVSRHTQLFHDDLRRYTKTRKAPIYWSLSTESGAYTVWLYYPRLTEDTLFKVVSQHVEPKLSKVRHRIAQLSGRLREASGADATRISSERSELEELETELDALRAELLRVARLPYRPNLDDGVEINAAPLWRLFPHRQWHKRMRTTWEKLEDGEYDWSHMALTLWPDRVRDVCRTDQSIAIAHDLEDLFDGEA